MLNGLAVAVAVGAGLAHWIPERLLAARVAFLFGLFGVLSLRAEAQDDTDQIEERGG